MDQSKCSSIAVPVSKMAAFRELTQIPAVSRPTVALAVIMIGAVLLMDWLAISGQLDLVVGCAVNTFVYYWFFTIIHDGVHRSISRNTLVNDIIGQAAVSVYAPFAAMRLFRWAHIEHHRFTNDAGDPDSWCHGRWWELPLRWMTIDIYYGYRALSSKQPAVKKVLRESLPYMIGGIGFIAAAILSGYGLELLFLWFIPSRLAFVGIGFSFFWLPHAHWPSPDRDLKQSSNLTIATTLRLGAEWLLNPVLQYQNYHLIHHLWPTTPFYNNERVWQLLEPEIRARDLAIVKAFTLQPEYVLAGANRETAPHA